MKRVVRKKKKIAKKKREEGQTIYLSAHACHGLVEVMVKEPDIAVFLERNSVATKDVHDTVGNASKQNSHNSARYHILIHAIVVIHNTQKSQRMHCYS